MKKLLACLVLLCVGLVAVAPALAMDQATATFFEKRTNGEFARIEASSGMPNGSMGRVSASANGYATFKISEITFEAAVINPQVRMQLAKLIVAVANAWFTHGGKALQVYSPDGELLDTRYR